MGDLKVKSFGLRSAVVGEVSKTKKWEMKMIISGREKKKKTSPSISNYQTVRTSSEIHRRIVLHKKNKKKDVDFV